MLMLKVMFVIIASCSKYIKIGIMGINLLLIISVPLFCWCVFSIGNISETEIIQKQKHYTYRILLKNFRGITFLASFETPISVIKLSVLIYCILKLTFSLKI
jgi:hypothetical protein